MKEEKLDVCVKIEDFLPLPDVRSDTIDSEIR